MKIKLNGNDKMLIRAYAKYCANKGYWPTEYECSKLIENMYGNHRDLVEDYLSALRIKQYDNEL